MAHFVGKTLHIRPNEILDSWGVPELIVAFGEYANEISQKNYAEWSQLPAAERRKVAHKPQEYNVKFFGAED